MKTPIRYYGGKQKLAKTIVSLIPKHNQYVEPFFGGGAVFFAKAKSRHEVINDRLGYVVNFYKCLQDRALFEELQELVRLTLHHEAEYDEAKEVLKQYDYKADGVSVRAAHAFWVNCVIAFASKLFAGFGFANNDRMPKAIKNYRDNFTIQLHRRLECVEIFCRDAVDVIGKKNTANTFIYADPPYFNSHMGHYGGYTEEDFEHLLDALSKHKGTFLLSSYDSSLLSEYQSKYGWYVIKKDMRISAAKGSNNKIKTEVMTMNYTPFENTLFQ